MHRVSGRLAKAYSVFALCDEAYALTASKDPNTLTSRRILWTQLGLHGSWAIGALAGGIVGATLLGGLEGLGFILTALFIVLTIDAYRATRDNLTLALATGAGVAAFALAPGSMVLVAMAIFTATLVTRHLMSRKHQHA